MTKKMTIEQLFTQMLKQFPDEPVYLLNPDGEVEEKTNIQDLLSRIVMGENQAIRFMKRYCAFCQASMFGKERCPLCQRPTEALTEKLVPIRRTLWQ